MKTKLLTICLLLFTFQVHANFIEAKWKVVGFVGEPWFADTNSIIGKFQSFSMIPSFSQYVFFLSIANDYLKGIFFNHKIF